MSSSLRRVWAITAKDILETRRDRLAPVFSLVMPLVFTLFFGLMAGGGGVELPVTVVNLDAGGAAATELVGALKQSRVVKVTMAGDAAAAERAVDDEDVAAALIVPAGFSQQLESGQPPVLTLVRPAGSTGAQTVGEEVRTAAARLVVVKQAAQAAALADPAIVVKTVAGASDTREMTAFIFSSTGMLINFIIFGLVGAAEAFIVERHSGTLRRLFTTRASRGQIVAGKVAGMFLLTFVQQCIIIGVGQLLFGVDYLNDPVALLLVMIGLSAMVSCLGLLLATVFSSEQALVATSVILAMAVSAMSGAWFSLDVTGEAFSTVGRLLPTASVLDALRGIILSDWGPAEVLPAVVRCLVVAAVLFGLAVWRFSVRLAE